MTDYQPSGIKVALALLLCSTMLQSVVAQQKVTRNGRILKVEGSVARLYESSDGTQLVELQLRSVALEDGESGAMGLRIPAPGETLYIVVQVEAPRHSDVRDRRGGLPAAGELIRASLISGEKGTWKGEGDWFESLGGSAPRTGRSDRGFERVPATVSVLGMSCDAILVGGQFGLRVKQVENSGPAKTAGFQPGDVVVAIDGKPLSSAADLRAVSSGSKPIKLSVVDVNTGRVATVVLTSTANSSRKLPPSKDADRSGVADSLAKINSSLGMEVESSRVGLRETVRVSSVKQGSPAAQAGLEPGDVIVMVGKTRVASVADFAASLPYKPSTLTFVVRDVNSGQEVPIEVNSAGFATEAESHPVQNEAPSDSNQQVGILGIVGELAFFDAEAAVKVVRVAPGSAAQRAGIRPGMILQSANGKPLLHPDDLSKAEQTSTGRLLLRVVDPATGQESTVKVEI